MVKNIPEFYDFVRTTYQRHLGKDVAFLAIGGSLGRGNYIDGWSDVDLLLVLSKIDAATLRRVSVCEKEISDQYRIEVDTMITEKRTMEHTPPKMLHGKIKNFLFFIDRAKVLISKSIVLPPVDYSDFVYGFWATYADQEKNYLRRNADSIITDRKSLEKLLKKNIKIIFLLLKQCFAEKDLVPCTYSEVVSLTQGKISNKVQSKLKEYIMARENNSIPLLTDESLRLEIDVSLNVFSELSGIMTKSLSI
jgi:hypothetical protein